MNKPRREYTATDGDAIPGRERSSQARNLVILPSRAQAVDAISGWMPWVGRGTLAVTDQGLFALSNFVLNVLLARWLAPADYGAFATAYSVFLSLLIFHNALLTAPMLVFGAGKYRECFDEYLGILLRGHFALLFPGSGILALVGLVFGRLYSPVVEQAFLALALAAPFILLLWLLRRAFYARLDPRWAALGGGVYFVILVAGAFALRTSGHFSPATGFFDMGIASLITCMLLLIILKPKFATTSSLIRAVAVDHWRYGKWVAASAGPGWFMDSIYFVLLPAEAGLAEAGALKALCNFAQPAWQTLSALGTLLLPVLVRDRRSGGPGAIKKRIKLVTISFVSGSAAYLALIWQFRLQIFRFLYEGKYSGYGSLPLLLVGLLPVIQSLPIVVSAGLGALEKPKLVFWATVGGASLGLVFGLPLAHRLGVSGALLGMAVSYALFGILALALFLRNARAAEAVNNKFVARV